MKNMASKKPINWFVSQFSLPQQKPNQKDIWIALIIFLVSLAAYVRTLAPDILYVDSAEFQTLAYTLGVTHSTGYPTYLFLARLIGFLPIHNPAWRISLFSAICAGITVAGVYLLARYFTRNRIGPVLGAMALAISYTFWSQAIIAEVYTPGMAFIVVIILLLFHWQIEPDPRNRALFSAAFLAGIGFGVHASVWLVALPALGLVIWRIWDRHSNLTDWKKTLVYASSGAILGLMVFLATFFISDQLNSPTSFIRTSLEPSRIFWDLDLEDFNSSVKRLKMTVISEQWGDSLFPGGDFSFFDEWNIFIDRLTYLEFSSVLIFFAVLGIISMLVRFLPGGIFFSIYFIFSLFFILNYEVGDKYVFYLSLYIPLSVAIGVGIGIVLEWVQSILQLLPRRSYQVLSLFPVLFFVTMILMPTAASRWQALRDGKADFVTETYVYPIYDLEEPRFVGERYLDGADSNAVFLLEWRTLFSTAYIAHVERKMTDTLFFEAMPYGHDGEVAATLIAQLMGYLEEGRPVFADHRYPGLEGNLRVLPVSGNLFKLSLIE